MSIGTLGRIEGWTLQLGTAAFLAAACAPILEPIFGVDLDNFASRELSALAEPDLRFILMLCIGLATVGGHMAKTGKSLTSLFRFG